VVKYNKLKEKLSQMKELKDENGALKEEVLILKK